MRRSRTGAWLSISLVLAMVLAACGDGDGGGADQTTVAGEEATTTAGGEPTSLRVMFPVNSPILHGFRVAEHVGYYEDEGLDLDFQFLDGGGEVVTQLLGGNGEIANIPVGPTVEAIEQGNTDLRAVWNYVYGSIIYIAVPVDSDMQTAADLEGKTIGITDLAGGEVPIVRGVIQSAGLDPDTDVELVPIGAATALTVRALEVGEVDAFGGSINDVIALQVQGIELRYILPEALLELPASGIVVRQELIDSQRDAVVGFLRASTKGSYWAQVNPDASLCVLKEVAPEQFAEDTGALIFEATLPITWAPEGQLMGFQSADSWGSYFDFVGAERPDIDLDQIVTDELLEEANDFDTAAVEEDANSYPSC